VVVVVVVVVEWSEETRQRRGGVDTYKMKSLGEKQLGERVEPYDDDFSG
jgi:hypothetical protein